MTTDGTHWYLNGVAVEKNALDVNIPGLMKMLDEMRIALFSLNILAVIEFLVIVTIILRNRNLARERRTYLENSNKVKTKSDERRSQLRSNKPYSVKRVSSRS